MNVNQRIFEALDTVKRIEEAVIESLPEPPRGEEALQRYRTRVAHVVAVYCQIAASEFGDLAND